MSYTVREVRLRDVLPIIYPIWQRHYAEMEARLTTIGLEVSPFAPRVEQCLKYSDEGWLLVWLLEHDGEAVGYSQGYVTNDMHNGDLIAQEDAIYVLPEHRHGAGRILLGEVHRRLRELGV